MSQRLAALGYDVVAQVTTIREAVDAVSTTEPDAVLFDVHLSDGQGVHGAISVTRARVGTAALVLSAHPALADRASRPNWGPVALIPADAEDADLDADVQEIVATARAMAEPELAPTSFDDEVEEVVEDVVEDVAGDVPDVVAHEVPDRDIPLVDVAVESTGSQPEEESREVVVERAVAQIVARTRLTPADALKLMEEEADEDGRDILEIATAILAEADAAA